MIPIPARDAVLMRLRAALGELYGERVERVLLFGSRARDDADDDSDHDVAVFLKDLREGDLAARWHELDRLACLRSEILSEMSRHSRESGNPGQATKRLPLDPRLRGGDEVVVQLWRNLLLARDPSRSGHSLTSSCPDLTRASTKKSIAAI